MSTAISKKSERRWLDALRQLIQTDIPLSNAMKFELLGYQDGCLTARAPLAPNINDKGTAFGGSQAALMSLVGWAVVWLETRKAGINCDIVIHKGEINWLLPLDEEILIQCQLPQTEILQNFLQDIRQRGKAAIHLRTTTSNGKNITSEFNCRYVAINKDN